MWTIRTPCRLHFGLLGLPAPGEHLLDLDARPLAPARRFGGVGLMLQDPAVVVRAAPAAQWSFAGPDRLRLVAERVIASYPKRPPRSLTVLTIPREHVGLGTGTQLGLAVARVLTMSWAIDLPAPALAALVGRGERSALGVHGFARGGFLVEGGKVRDELSPLIARLDFPEEWPVVLLLPRASTGVHGTRERAAFARLTASPAATEAMSRLVLQGLLPSLAGRDFDAFGDALRDYNARAGAMFAAEQGGLYADAETTELVARCRALGVRGVGQSSWGPGVFAVCRDPDDATRLLASLGDTGRDAVVTAARNAPAGE